MRGVLEGVKCWAQVRLRGFWLGVTGGPGGLTGKGTLSHVGIENVHPWLSGGHQAGAQRSRRIPWDGGESRGGGSRGEGVGRSQAVVAKTC